MASRRAMTFVFVSLAALLVLLAVVWLWATGWPQEPAEMGAPIVEGTWGAPPPGERPSELRILSYNIHYGAGREDDFERRADRATVERTLDGIAAFIRARNPDVVLLQEVDYDSARTHGIDELDWIARKTGLRYLAPVVTWKARYLLWPYSAPYGRMDSGQAILSKWPIVSHRRLRLPKPDNKPFWYNAFYLNRTLQHARLDVAGRPLDVFNVHTEAYDVANRRRHAELIVETLPRWMSEWTILAGDFNAVPPEATKKHDFADEPEQDMRADESIAAIRKLGLEEIVPEARYRADEAAALSFPADAPSRRLDYLFFTPNFALREGGILREAGLLSDHLPTTAVLGWP